MPESREARPLDVSLVIPCYNAGDMLKGNVEALRRILSWSRFSFEIILVDDKSTDNTAEVCKELAGSFEEVRFIAHEVNMGRGQTVTDGIYAAKGRVVGFIDIDLEVPAYNIYPLIIEVLEDKADIATGHRIYRRKVTPLRVGPRWIASVAYGKLRRFVTSTDIRDSETGIKFFNREKIIPILERIEDRHWFWDTEVMVHSCYEGLRIKEIPVLFLKNPSVKSTVKYASDSWYYFRKLMRFRKVVKKYKRQKKRADA